MHLLVTVPWGRCSRGLWVEGLDGADNALDYVPVGRCGCSGAPVWVGHSLSLGNVDYHSIVVQVVFSSQYFLRWWSTLVLERSPCPSARWEGVCSHELVCVIPGAFCHPK